MYTKIQKNTYFNTLNFFFVSYWYPHFVKMSMSSLNYYIYNCLGNKTRWPRSPPRKREQIVDRLSGENFGVLSRSPQLDDNLEDYEQISTRR